MNESSEKLSPSELFDAAGHLTDIAVTSVADAELDILTADAIRHAESCEACARRVGEAALLSAELTDAFALADAPAAEVVTDAHPVHIPWAALGIACALMVIGALPRLAQLPSAGRALSNLVHDTLPVLFRAVADASSHAENAIGPGVTLACAALFVSMGAIVARRSAIAQKRGVA